MSILLTSSPAAPARAAQETEAATSSKVSGTGFGAMPDRDLRPQVVSTSAAYLGQLAKQVDANATVSEVEVITYRGPLKPEAVSAYQKLVTDNLAKAGFAYKVTNTQTVPGQSLTYFTADGAPGRIIGYWQVTDQGMFLHWGKMSGGAAPPVPPPLSAPAAQQAAPQPAGNDNEAEIAELKRRLAQLEGKQTPAAQSAPQPGAQPSAQPAPVAVEPPKPLPALSVKEPSGKPKDLVKLSQYESSVWSRCTDLIVGPDGKIHAIFVEGTTGKPAYLYYRASSDDGKTWSAPENLSDNEKNNDASYGRILVDGRGRVYAIWKYVAQGEILDGPGGQAAGKLSFRVLEGGKWGRINTFPGAGPYYSWFACLDSHGAVQVVWSKIAEDVMKAKFPQVYSTVANLVEQGALDGPTLGQVKQLVVPERVYTEEEFKAAGKPVDYDKIRPKPEGLINLSGYVDSNGVAHFLAERHDPQALWHFDGQKLEKVYEYVKYASGNTFQNPPVLMVDEKGVEHVIRKPEKAEKTAIRDYAVVREGGTLSLADPTPVFEAPDAKRDIPYFQASQKGGRLAVMAEIAGPDVLHAEADLYISFWDIGKWTAPLCVTDNAARATFFSKDTSAVTSVAQAASYNVKYASVAYDRDGHPLLLMDNVQHTITGLTNAVGTTVGGRVAVATGGFSTENPKIFFLKL